MKLLTLIYDEALDEQVTPVFGRHMAVVRYSKIEGVVGARMDALADSEFATDQRNNIILLLADHKTMSEIVADLQHLRDQVGQGIRGAVTEAEVVI